MDLTLSWELHERDLIEACVARERWAQQRLYEEFYPKMMGVCLRYANDDSDALDILHEGFIKIFKHIGSYQPNTSLTAWVRRVMVNTSIDYYRKNTRRRTDDIDTAYNLSSDAPDAISQCSEKDILLAVQQLTPAYRAVFNLYVIEGFSHRDISEQLNITESTSRSNLVKARLKLQALLTKKFDLNSTNVGDEE
jgi:RNA polymerase sigma factor (sigma-70 family)